MSQQLNVSLNIPVPSDQVLINKVELQELKQQSLTGQYWNMKDLEQRTNRKQEWIKENILITSRFRTKLNSEMCGFVLYTQSKGQTWSCQANQMAEFVDKRFSIIFGGAYMSERFIIGFYLTAFIGMLGFVYVALIN